MLSDEMFPCGCDQCDSLTLTYDSYCAKCLHHGCGYEVKCQ